MNTHNVEPGLVSTIIPVFNRPTLVREAIESVLAQTYRPIEIIVIDDGSTDDTYAVLKKLAEHHSELTILKQDNAGPGVARELGRQNAKGDFIQYLDSDDLLLPEKFNLQVKALLEKPECGVVYGKTEMTNMGEPLSGVAMRETGVETLSMFPQFLKSRWWGTSTPLYRKSVLIKVGAWLPTSNEEDWEYDCRVASTGCKLAYVDEFVSHARRHDAHLSAYGTTDETKLNHRCIAQKKIYEHALSYMTLNNRPSNISIEDWLYYSKSVFLLARQCASVGLNEQAKEMFLLSIKANGSSNLKHKLFYFFASVIGWQKASKLLQWMGK